MTIQLTISEAKMIDEKNIPNTQEQVASAQQVSEEQDLVPPQYRGLPSEVVEEMWQNPVYTDAEKNNAETQRRQQALEQLKLEESNRETNKQQILTERYSKLPPEVRQDFPTAQTDAVNLIAEHLNGARRLDDKLTSEERFILQKAEDVLKEAQKQNPEQQSINVSFSKQIDQQIYNNLVNRLTFEVLKAKGVVKDQEQANEIRGQMGLPEAEVHTPDLLSEPATDVKNPTLQKETEDSSRIESAAEQELSERDKRLQKEMAQILEMAWNSPAIHQTIKNFKEKSGSQETDFQIFCKVINPTFGNSPMYDLIHQSGMSYEQVMQSINVPDRNAFISNFEDYASRQVVEAATKVSNIRQITPDELSKAGHPDQAANFVWFKGNAPKPANAREVRFYINAKPEGITDIAENLSKISDYCDQQGFRMQFKFRKNLDEYDRTDTCVAYVYLPDAKTDEQKDNSDKWVQAIAREVGKMPKEAIRDNVSLFTEKVSDGVALVEDTRTEGSKTGESYTSQISKSIGEVATEVAKNNPTLTPELMSQITQEAFQKLKQIGY